VVSAGANIGLNLLLIPRYGMVGAAWATALSFFIMSALSFTASQRAYPIPYVFTRVMSMIGLAIFTYLLSTFVALPTLAWQLSIKIGLLAAFPIALYRFGFFSKGEVERGKTLTQAILSRYFLLKPAESE
jgi:O-antigen/teichoic acid export membrane protein